MSRVERKSQFLPLLVLVLAWLVPGAGHICLKRFARGIIILVMISATFWTGIAIGGVMTVDPQNERWWFVADMLAGVHGLIGWQRQQRLYDRLELRLRNDAEYVRLVEESGVRGNEEARRVMRQRFFDELLQEENLALVSPVDTSARAYAAVAGLLNLMCMFDAAMLALIGRGLAKRPPT